MGRFLRPSTFVQVAHIGFIWLGHEAAAETLQSSLPVVVHGLPTR